jgi:hypothetical protein
MSKRTIQLAITIADRLVDNELFMALPEAADLRRALSKSCVTCRNKRKSKARNSIIGVLEAIAKSASSSIVHTLLISLYGDKQLNFRIPGTSGLIIKGS